MPPTGLPAESVPANPGTWLSGHLSPLPPASAQARNKSDDNFDGPATEAADIAGTLVTDTEGRLRRLDLPGQSKVVARAE